MSISVCIPARNEARTIGTIVTRIHEDLVVPGIVDELIVLDHDSHDGTSYIAQESGATVVEASRAARDYGPALGKGDVLWRSLLVSTGDIVVWVDADLEAFRSEIILRLIRPLMPGSPVMMTKGAYLRDLNGQVGEGGRVTELAAKPALRLLRPDLGHISQPLAGQCAVRREAVEQLTFEVDYGVEMALLLDIAALYGPQSVVEVDLGAIHHRHQSLRELSVQSEQVLRALLSRHGHRELLHRTEGRPPIEALLLALPA
jgi:glucosyl-3-phosphoglycerate synthase